MAHNEHSVSAEPHIPDPRILVLQSPSQPEPAKEEAWGSIVADFTPYVTYIALHHSRSVDIAETVVQESFISFWKRIDRFDSDMPITGLLGKVAFNKTMDELRKRYLTPIDTALEMPESGTAVAIAEQDDDPAQAAEAKALLELIQQLPENQQRVATLTVMGYSQKEIAEELGIPHGTVKSRMRFAQQNLMKLGILG